MLNLTVISTGGSPYKVMADQTEVSSHSTWHKALQSAVNTEFEDPTADVRILRVEELRVELPSQLQDPGPEPEPVPDPGPAPAPEPEPEPEPEPNPVPVPPVPPAPGAYDAAWFDARVSEFIAKAQNIPSIQSATNNDTYYDVGAGHYKLAAFTNDSGIESEARRVLALYLSRYATGTKPGYWTFTEGARISLEKGDGACSMSQFRHLRDNMAFNRAVDFHWADSSAPNNLSGFHHKISRELSYLLMAHIDGEKLGDARRNDKSWRGPDRPLVHELVEFSEKHFHQFVDQSGNRTAPFMVGISMRALIQYHEWELANGRTPFWITDRWADIPTMIEDVCQKLVMMKTTDGAADLYREEGGNTGGFQYEDKTATALAYDLNMLIAPGYEWAYQFGPSKDVMLRNVADRLFKGGVDSAYTGSGKQWGQFTLWSFEQIGMRV